MTSTYTPEQLTGRTAVDRAGDKIGKISQVYLDDQTGQPNWITVSTGLFGTRESFAPLSGATVSGDDVVLAVTKDQVKDAPNLDADEHVDDSGQRALYDYYSGIYSASGTAGTTGGVSHDAETSGTDNAMTRSEEQLHVGTEQVATGRARLRKYVVTEQVTQTIPVQREEVRVEREPITEANIGQATSGAEISEDVHEVTLHAERPVVAKETVPVERVRLDTETVTDQATVDETVRKEQIEFEDGSDTPGKAR